jgi:hypothetical protein
MYLRHTNFWISVWFSVQKFLKSIVLIVCLLAVFALVTVYCFPATGAAGDHKRRFGIGRYFTNEHELRPCDRHRNCTWFSVTRSTHNMHPYTILLLISLVQDSTSTSAEYRARPCSSAQSGTGHAKMWRCGGLTNMKCQWHRDGSPFRKGTSLFLMP